MKAQRILLSPVTLLSMGSLAVTHHHQRPGPSTIKCVTVFLTWETVLLTYFQADMPSEELSPRWGGDWSYFLTQSPFNKALL